MTFATRKAWCRNQSLAMVPRERDRGTVQFRPFLPYAHLPRLPNTYIYIYIYKEREREKIETHSIQRRQSSKHTGESDRLYFVGLHKRCKTAHFTCLIFHIGYICYIDCRFISFLFRFSLYGEEGLFFCARGMGILCGVSIHHIERERRGRLSRRIGNLLDSIHRTQT